jgi:hypothetical protein
VLVFFAYIIGVLGMFILIAAGLTYIVVALVERRPGPLHVIAGALCGFVSGALFIWILVPRTWPLSLWTTLAATVDAAKYGHALEHAAEGIAIWMMFGGVVGAVAGGFVAGKAGGLRKRCRVAASGGRGTRSTTPRRWVPLP